MNRRKAQIGLAILLAAIIFRSGETYYFGTNQYAQSLAEWACDSIANIATVVGCWKLFNAFFTIRN